MAQPYPLPRSTRETEIKNGDGGATYGPFDFKIFDDVDVRAFVRRNGEEAFEAAELTVAKVDGQPFDDFTVTFDEPLAADDDFIVQSARLHERLTAITKGGTISARELEKELSKQGSVIEELRRDVDRSWKSDFDVDEYVRLAPEDGKVIGWINGKPANVANSAGEASAEAQDARDARVAAEAAMTATFGARDEAYEYAISARVAANSSEENADRSQQEAAQAGNEAGRAEQAAERAETARDAATVNASVFADIAAGLSGTSEGDQFQVVEGDEIVRYRHDAGPSATEIARYPAANRDIKRQSVGYRGSMIAGPPLSGSTFILNEPVAARGYVRRIVGYGLNAGFIFIKRAVKVGDTFTCDSYMLMIPAGPFSLDAGVDFDPIPVETGQFLGFFHNVSGGARIGRVDGTFPGVFVASGDQVIFTDDTVDTTSYPILRFEIEGVSDLGYLGIETRDTGEQIERARRASYAAGKQIFGAAEPIAAISLSSGTPYVWATPVEEDCIIAEVAGVGVSPASLARSFMLRRYAERDGILYEIPHRQLVVENVPVGPFRFTGDELGDFMPRAGEYIGFFPGAGLIIGRTPDLVGQPPIYVGTTGFVPGSNAVSMTSPVTNFRPELRVTLVRETRGQDSAIRSAANNAAFVEGNALLNRICAGRKWSWLDMADHTTLYRDVSGTRPVTTIEQPVRCIRDKSGNGYDFTANSTFGRWGGAVNWPNGVEFDGVSSAYSAVKRDLTNDADHVTIFAVFSDRSSAPVPIIGHSIAAASTNARVLLGTRSAVVRRTDADAAVQPQAGARVSDHARIEIAELRVEYASGRASYLSGMRSHIDGERTISTGTTGATDEAAVTLGSFPGDPLFKGTMHEIIEIVGPLDDGDRNAINRYLATKYALPFETPADYSMADAIAGAWTWYTDPRVLAITPQKAIAGVNTPRGSVAAAVYDFAASPWDATDHVMLSSLFQENDHDNPAFVELSSGHLLAFWARHNGPDYWMAKTTVAGDLTSFGAPVNIFSQLAQPGELLAYANPIMLPDEAGRVYLFARIMTAGSAIWCFGVAWSDDDGVTWTQIKPLFNTNARPYIKFRRNGDDRIDLIVNDAHPNQAPGNKTYHMFLQGGSFHQSDGTLIGALNDLPFLAPSDASVAFDPTIYPDRRSWVMDLTVDGSGRPVATVGVYDTNFVHHEYWQARWTGSAWKHAKVCDAGGPLSNQDAVSYSGLAITHPENPNVIYSSRQLLDSGQPSPNGPQWHLCKSTSSDNGDTWTTTWLAGKPKEFLAGRQQIRPYIAEGMPTRLWYLEGGYTHWAGRYNTRVGWKDI